MEGAGAVAGGQLDHASTSDRQNGQSEEPSPNGRRRARFWRTLPDWMRWTSVSGQPRPGIARGLLPLLELLILLLWTLLVTRPYLNLDPSTVPTGREFLQHISANLLWTNFQDCGACAFWNGGIRGGYPAFADLQESMLHPLVALTTLAFGVVNGSKLALVGAFLLTGLAQWWLGWVIRLGPAARLWTAAMAVIGGHLAARMEHGIFGLVLAIASCSLVLPALIRLSQTGSRRSAVVLGITLALAIYAGQGYIQVGLLLASPAALVLFLGRGTFTRRLLRRLALAGGLALLLAAPFLVPMLHFLPQVAKNVDPAFESAQPLAFVPLNLVVNDLKFYNTDVLGKIAYPWLYIYFIGWLPVLLAAFGFLGHHEFDRRRLVTFLGLFTFLALWLASGRLLAWVGPRVPIPLVRDWIYGIRYPALFTALAVPPILALAGAGLDRILTWPRLRLQMVVASGDAAPSELTLNLAWLMILPLALSLSTAWSFNRQWISTTVLGPGVGQVLDALRTPDVEWVDTPFGEQFWVEPAVSTGLKLALGTMGWAWRDHQPPAPVLEAGRGTTPPPGMTLQTTIDQISIFRAGPGREYAAVTMDNGRRSVCVASGMAGNLEVSCRTPDPGRLIVKENYWPGWRAELDGRPVPIVHSGPADQWLAVDLPYGSHTILFRYRPWDVTIGMALGCLGGLLALFIVLRGSRA